MPVWLALIDPISKLLDRLIPDPDARAKAQLELVKEENAQALQELQIAAQADANQVEVNKVEAANENLFISGWRPAVGWCCALAFAYSFVIQPLLAFAISNSTGTEAILPDFDMDALNTVLFGMLGISTLRTVEKVRGVKK
ncbi:holin family protein [Limnoglobus roseus]|uniref:Holin of 3TMs, for gene-transfer release n=1 Tax=Limnoglobus roseus TaxID=2598579 RepID=A0A5C1AKD5_9BACT|nr:holin family protein [Limnoglobus roseus]QEL19350.1 hypothetical protein PX52LOC_06419 [Limnoglobus roseus]